MKIKDFNKKMIAEAEFRKIGATKSEKERLSGIEAVFTGETLEQWKKRVGYKERS